MHAKTALPENSVALEIRVTHSLQRIGYEEIQVVHLGGGHVKLSGKKLPADDVAIVIATARIVAGVKFVTCDFHS